MWWKGPEWLLNDKFNVEMYEITEETKFNIRNEERGTKVLYEVGLVSDNDNYVTPFNINDENFSSYHRLIRVTAWCLRFWSNLKGEKTSKGFLSDGELSKSCTMWKEAVQNQNFSELLNKIEKGKTHSLVNLDLYTLLSI